MIRNCEFFTSPNGDVIIELPTGERLTLAEGGSESRAFIEEMMERLATYYPEAWNRLKELYGRYANNRWHYEFLIVSRFIRCNFGEKEVLSLIVQHLDKEAIGEALHISPYTVSNHVRHIYTKTGKRSEAELVEYWFYNNI